MSAPYKIAEYLSDEAKREMVEHQYTADGPQDCRRTPGGCCPLAIGLMEMHPVTACFVWAPTATEVADILYLPNHDHNAIVVAASEFITDWDSDHITDLAAALGVA
jgi:hypothetical protein